MVGAAPRRQGASIRLRGDPGLQEASLTSPAGKPNTKAVKFDAHTPSPRTARRLLRELTAAYGRACYEWAIAQRLAGVEPIPGLPLAPLPSASACYQTTSYAQFGTRRTDAVPITPLCVY